MNKIKCKLFRKILISLLGFGMGAIFSGRFDGNFGKCNISPTLMTSNVQSISLDGKSLDFLSLIELACQSWVTFQKTTLCLSFPSCVLPCSRSEPELKSIMAN